MSTSEKTPIHVAAALAVAQVTFISLPLIIYIAALTLFLPPQGWAELAEKPEWMFIGLMLQVEAVRHSIAAAAAGGAGVSAALQDNLLVMHIIVLLLYSLALFAVIGRYEKAFSGSEAIDSAQWFLLAYAVFSCWLQKYRHYRQAHT